MAALTSRKPAGWWQTGATMFSRGPRPILVAVDPQGVLLRLKKERQEYRVDWSTIYLLAVQANVAAERERKAAARKAKRGGNAIG